MLSNLMRKYIDLLAEDNSTKSNIFEWVYVRPELKTELGKFVYVAVDGSNRKEFATVEELAQYLATHDIQYDYSGFAPNPMLTDKLNRLVNQYAVTASVRKSTGTGMEE